MIVWLASYPRSGNTLLRTVLHQTMGFPTYSDEVDPEVRSSVGLSDSISSRFGRSELPQPWEAFYPQASESPKAFLVKTHQPPRDAQPAIYVVRDGRSALVSYENFHRKFLAEKARKLLDLVLGHDYYGGWSEHYYGWAQRPGARTLVVRFEELVDAPHELLQRIAQLVGRDATASRWDNPFQQMNRENPGFFREGSQTWNGDAAWTPFIDRAFFRLHGALMTELGYASTAEVDAARSAMSKAEVELIDLARSVIAEARGLEHVCRERQTVIDGLQRACEERLALIERLSPR